MFGRSRSSKPPPVVVKGMNKAKKLEKALGDIEMTSPKKSCLLCIGSPGSGKTATIAKYLEKKPTELSIESTRNHFELYQSDSNVIIETHFDWDENKLEIESVIDEVIQFMENQGIETVKAVIWTIIPTYQYVARDSALSRQAEVIDSLDRKRIWSNVLVVCKLSAVPNRDGAGAVKASKLLGAEVEPKVVGYRFYDEFIRDHPSESENAQNLDQLNVKRDEQVTEILRSAIHNMVSIRHIDIQSSEKKNRKTDNEDEDDVEDLFLGDDSHDQSVSIYDHEYCQKRKIKTFLGLPPIVLPNPL